MTQAMIIWSVYSILKKSLGATWMFWYAMMPPAIEAKTAESAYAATLNIVVLMPSIRAASWSSRIATQP